jgi:hypothetical protein
MDAFTPNGFTAAFLCALALATATRLWLAQRQIAHVVRNRGAVPRSFLSTITLPAHQKAADYSVAKSRLGIVDVLFGAAVLLLLTLGGGVQWIAAQWSRVLDPAGYWHGVALVMSVVLLLAVLDLHVAIYRTFVVEARFGFNRMTPALFVADLLKQALLGAALGVPLLLLVLWLMGRMGELWWLYVWLAWMGFNRYTPSPQIVLLPVLIVLTVLLSMGFAFALSAMTVTYRDLRFLIPFITQIGMWMSAAVFSYKSVFKGKMLWIQYCNPFFGIIDSFRSAMFPGWGWQPWHLLASIFWTAGILIFGLFYFRKTERRFADIA